MRYTTVMTHTDSAERSATEGVILCLKTNVQPLMQDITVCYQLTFG